MSLAHPAQYGAVPKSTRLLVGLSVAHFLDHYFLLIFPTAILAIQSEWQMTYGELLKIGSTTFIAFAVFTLPAGWLGDRFNRSGLMCIFFFGCGLAAILTSLATGPYSLAIGLGVLGAFAAIYHPVATAMVVQLSSKTGQALAINGVAGNMGVALAAVVTGVLTAWIDWRAAFVVPGVCSILIGAAFVRFALQPETTANQAKRSAARIPSTRQEQWRLVTVIALVALLSGFTFNGLTVGLPKLLQDRIAGEGASISEVGALATFVLAAAAFAQLPVGWLLDKVGAKPMLISIVGVQAVLLALLSVSYGPVVVMIGLPLMLVVFGEIPINSWLISRHVASRWHARVYSLNFLASLGLSTAAIPFMGYLYDRTGGFTVFLQLLAVAAACLFLAAWLLPGRQPRLEASPSQA